jgi:ABC-2 type transport system ATP-binding protein
MPQGTVIEERKTIKGPAIEVVSLGKSFGPVRAVHDLSFTVNAGEIFGLVGPDGAGKTTTMRMLAGVLPPDSGRATVSGCDIASNPEGAKHDLSYMPQRFGLYDDLTVLREHRFLCRSVQRETRRARHAREVALASRRAFGIRRAPGRQAFRRHEAKTRISLRADSSTGRDPSR